MARGLLATWNFTAHKGIMLLAIVAGCIGAILDAAPAQLQERAVTTSDTLGVTARQAMSDIFQKKDATAVDRYFGESFIQHDPSIADGLAGMKSFAAEAANSRTADITTYRTLVDGDFVLLHSKYQGLARYAGPVIAFDLFRFRNGKIVEHWGGQEPEAPPNLSGRTQATSIEADDVERILADIDAHGGNVAIDSLDMAVLRLTRAPSQHHVPVGQEHGRTIPLAVIGIPQNWSATSHAAAADG